VSDPVAGSTSRFVRVQVMLHPDAGADDFLVAVVAIGGRIVSRDSRTITADVPGGAMGRLALVPGVASISAGESWDTPGKQPPDGTAAVRQRIEMRERKAGRGAPKKPEED